MSRNPNKPPSLTDKTMELAFSNNRPGELVNEINQLIDTTNTEQLMSLLAKKPGENHSGFYSLALALNNTLQMPYHHISELIDILIKIINRCRVAFLATNLSEPNQNGLFQNANGFFWICAALLRSFAKKINPADIKKLITFLVDLIDKLDANTIAAAFQAKITLGPYRGSSAFSILVRTIESNPSYLYTSRLFFADLLKKIMRSNQPALIDSIRAELFSHKEILKPGLKTFLNSLSLVQLKKLSSENSFLSELIDHQTGITMPKTETRGYVENLIKNGEIGNDFLLFELINLLKELKDELTAIESNTFVFDKAGRHRNTTQEIKITRAAIALLRKIAAGVSTKRDYLKELIHYKSTLHNHSSDVFSSECLALNLKVRLYLLRTEARLLDDEKRPFALLKLTLPDFDIKLVPQINPIIETPACIINRTKILPQLSVTDPRLFSTLGRTISAEKSADETKAFERLIAQIDVPKSALVLPRDRVEQPAREIESQSRAVMRI